jgi:hypothetical protein
MILDNGFEISALQMFYLDRPTSEEFFEVYKVRNFFCRFNGNFIPIFIQKANLLFDAGLIKNNLILNFIT